MTYEHRFWLDEDQLEFIRAKYPGPIFEAYHNLRIGAARADLWRILVLLEYGGVYLDIDATLVWPLEAQITDETAELFILDRAKKLTNFFVASESGNAHLTRIIDTIVHNIQTQSSKNIYNLTGPNAVIAALKGVQVNAEIQQYVCDQGQFTNESFQYVDHPFGKWYREQNKHGIFK